MAIGAWDVDEICDLLNNLYDEIMQLKEKIARDWNTYGK